MINSLPPYLLYIFAIAGSFLVSLYAVKKIIFITKDKKIFDIPDNIRKIHGAQIPSLGGIGIFTGYIIIASFFMITDNSRWNYILVSSVILFFTGIYDDLANMRPLKKLIAQLIASAITICFTVMPALYSDAAPEHNVLVYYGIITVLTISCTFFINAFNFIDGIDGLACTLAILSTLVLGILFAFGREPATAAIIFSLTGATIGLFYYNKAPAKIYMGDTGSMLIGFNIFIFSVLWPVTSKTLNSSILDHSAILILIAVLFLPSYDAVRVFILRISKGISPLKADRSHLHYYLLDAGFSHSKSVLIITATNLLLIGLAFFLWPLNLAVVVLIYALVVSAVLVMTYKLRQKKLHEQSDI